jgi:iron-sulfur cluster assembly protein
MLTLTENARTVVKGLTDQALDPNYGGLRISTTDAGANFAITLAPAPEPTDEIVENEGVRVFIADEATKTLSDKLLDAQIEDEGGVRFAIRESGV